MYQQNILYALLAALSVSAVPLNINLGAYSPALVVGDGEISFGGAQNAGELIETLATGAATAAGARAVEAAVVPAGTAAPETAAAVAVPETTEAEVEVPDVGVAATVVEPVDGIIGEAADARFKNVKRSVEAPVVQTRAERVKRDIEGFREALRFATEAQKNQPKIELGSENAGVGIVVSPGVNVPAGSPAAGGVTAEKRSVESPANQESKGITLVAIAEI